MRQKFIYPLLGLLVFLLAGCASMAINQGDEKLKEKHYYEAAKSYLAALSYEPGNQDAKTKLSQIAKPAYDEKLATAQSYDKAEAAEQALKEYEELSALIDGLNKYVGITFPVIAVRERIIQHRTVLAAGHYAEAEKAFEGADYFTAAQQYRRALTYLKPYKDSTEKLAESYYRLGIRYEMERNFRQAAEYYERADETLFGYKDARTLALQNKSIADELDASRHYRLALELGEERRYEDAILELKTTLSYVPRYKNAQELIAKYTHLVKEEEAEEYYGRGIKLMAQGRFAEAKKDLDEAAKIVPDYRDAKELSRRCQQNLDLKEASGHYEKGLKHAADQDYEGAVKEFELAEKTLPGYKDSKDLIKKYKALAEEKGAKEKEAKEQKEKEEKENKGQEQKSAE